MANDLKTPPDSRRLLTLFVKHIVNINVAEILKQKILCNICDQQNKTCPSHCGFMCLMDSCYKGEAKNTYFKMEASRFSSLLYLRGKI